MASPFTVIWEFLVPVAKKAEFEQVYGPGGAWAQLFRQSPDYRGTDLLHDQDRRERYLTIDHWTSREALEEFKREHQSAYASLDERCELLTQNENLIGNFEM